MKTIVVFVLMNLLQTQALLAQEYWRSPSNDNIVYMQLDSGLVIIELAPQFAPNHVTNIKKLVSQKYFDGTAIIRSQDNYVVQWGDPNEGEGNAKSLGKASLKLNTEFYRNIEDLNFTPIISRDAYAQQVGFVDGFPVASDGKKAWLAHCYGMLGVSRGMDEDSGNGAGLYVVTGHSPRHLDLNVTLVGRVLSGMELLSSLPRGTGALGFYETAQEYASIRSLTMPSEKHEALIKVMKTDSSEFKQHVLKRTNRTEEWFLEPTGKIELCNVGVPVEMLKDK